MNDQFDEIIRYMTTWVQTNVLTWGTAAQWICVVMAYLFTLLVWRGTYQKARQWVNESITNELFRSVLTAFIGIGNLVVFVTLMLVCANLFQSQGLQPTVLVTFGSLASAGIVIRLLSGLIPNRTVGRIVSTGVWIVATLHIFDLLSPITDSLESLSITMGGSSFTALGAIKGVLLAALCLQAASVIAQFTARRIENTHDLSPSLQVLLTKAVKIGLFTTAILFAMSSVGIDLTSLAIFSSALGVGIGFGLKTIFSNFVAGVLLLMDDSIKPGDTIEVGGVFGVVRDMHGRYTSILTRDGKEYLVPNEHFVVNEVINWTYSDTNIRIKIPVGISYCSDVKKAMELLERAADGIDRVLTKPAPSARLMAFGDNSVDLQLRVWIADAEEGIASVRSALLLKIWDLYHENDIKFPFPQRDVLLKADSALTVKIDKDGKE